MYSQNYLSNLSEQDKTSLVLHDNIQALKPYDYREERAREENDEIDLRELWQVIVRRKWLILSIALLVLALAVIITFMMTPIYRASTTLQIDPENQNILKYDIQAQAQNNNANTKDFYQTQYELLQSGILANRVIEQLGLESILKGDQLVKPFFAEQWDNFKQSFVNDKKTTEEASTPEPQGVLLGEQPVSASDPIVCDVYASTNVPVAIADVDVTTSTLTVSGAGISINDLNVLGLQGTHTWVSDLTVELTSPG